MSETNTTPALSAEVAAKYSLHGVSGGKVILPERYGRKEVNFNTMTLAEAEELVKLKDFPYLKAKPAAATTK